MMNRGRTFQIFLIASLTLLAYGKGGVLGVSDPPVVLWNRTYPNILTGDLQTIIDEPMDMRMTGDGGYVIAGSRLTQSENMDADLDAFLIRTDGSGNLIWSRNYGTPRVEDGVQNSKDDIAHSVVECPAGGFLFVGSTNSYEGIPKTSYLARIDEEGGMLWNRSLGGIEARCIMRASDGGYMVGLRGKYYNYIEDSYVYQITFVKIDEDGTQQWNRTLEYEERVFLSSMEATNDGGYVLGLYNDQRTFVLKVNRFCEVQWSRFIDPENAFAVWDRSYSVRETMDGGYIVLGAIFSSSSLDDDTYMVKMDNYGQIIWNRTYNYAFRDLRQTPDGGYVLVGRRKTSDGFQGHDYDLYFVKTDPGGEEIWYLWLEEEPFDESSTGIMLTEDLNYVVTGNRGPAGLREVFLMKLETVSSPGILMSDEPPTCLENAGSIRIPVFLTETSDQTVTVDYRVLNSTAYSNLDFLGVQGTLVFDPGEGIKEVDIPIILDSLDEETERAILYLDSPTNAELLHAYRSFHIEDIYPPNHPPILEDGYVSPVSGLESDAYRYYAIYDDPDGDPPESLQVYIDGIAQDMDLLNGTEPSGLYCTGEVELMTGEHDFYFLARDSAGYTSRLPPRAKLPGPVVEEVIPRPSIWACNAEGENKTGFWPTQNAYVCGKGFDPDIEYTIYVIDDYDNWEEMEGQEIPPDGVVRTFKIGPALEEGEIPVILAWESPLDLGLYDLLADDGDGLFETRTDGLSGEEGHAFRVWERAVVNPFEPEIIRPMDCNLTVSVKDGVTREPLQGAMIRINSASGEVWNIEQGKAVKVPPGNYTIKTQIRILGFPVTIQSKEMEVVRPTRMNMTISFLFIPVKHINTLIYGLLATVGIAGLVSVIRKIR